MGKTMAACGSWTLLSAHGLRVLIGKWHAVWRHWQRLLYGLVWFQSGSQTHTEADESQLGSSSPLGWKNKQTKPKHGKKDAKALENARGMIGHFMSIGAR
jgi:hypothetical protein